MKLKQLSNTTSYLTYVECIKLEYIYGNYGVILDNILNLTAKFLEN